MLNIKKEPCTGLYKTKNCGDLLVLTSTLWSVEVDGPKKKEWIIWAKFKVRHSVHCTHKI